VKVVRISVVPGDDGGKPCENIKYCEGGAGHGEGLEGSFVVMCKM